MDLDIDDLDDGKQVLGIDHGADIGDNCNVDGVESEPSMASGIGVQALFGVCDMQDVLVLQLFSEDRTLVHFVGWDLRINCRNFLYYLEKNG